MQVIYDIAEICARKGIDTVVISPGSRSAPLVFAFARHPKIEKHVILDERSAAYTALGMALTSGKTVALICTSGTAAVNFAPAITEAFYLNIPLLVLTADRPPEWVDQADGQTIRQQNLYGRHVKKSYQLPTASKDEDTIWHINRIINEAINIASLGEKGPVHVNVPLKEPLYPKEDFVMHYSNVRIIQSTVTSPQIIPEHWEQMRREFNSCEKRILILGQLPYNPEFIRELKTFVEGFGIVLIADVTSNAHFLKTEFIHHQDLFLAHTKTEQLAALKPEMVISMGGSVISKQLKLFLRTYPGEIHWHVNEAEQSPDTFRQLSRHIPLSPYSFLRMANRTSSGLDTERMEENYLRLWEKANNNTAFKLKEYQSQLPFSDFSVVNQLVHLLPNHSILHVANSMPIRYVNFVGLPRAVEVHANRGTSGIDGCLSTAIGAARKTTKIVTLLIGDLAFFYDNNALFQQPLPGNLRIVVLNNHSGNIFSIIDGPSHLPESKPYFETSHHKSVRFLTEGYGLKYLACSDQNTLKRNINELYNQESTALLEILTHPQHNVDALKGFYKFLRENFGY